MEYDLFGEDVGGAMLDGLSDLGSDNFGEPSAPQSREPTAAAPTQYPSYPHQIGELHQESPLQKLASFGGEYASNHIDSGGSIYHGNHAGYPGETPRPMHPTTSQTAGYSRGMMSQHEMRRPTGPQYPSYNMTPDNMYSMDQSQGLTDWAGGHFPSSVRHYNMQPTPSQYRQTVNYPHQQETVAGQKMSQSYGSSQQNIMNPMMHQPMQGNSYQRTQQQQQQQQGGGGGGLQQQ
uniref:Uncharacterized protein n=1 Tax=Lygus hesperus TaxID=30085 RepID=A0A0K8SZE4_LYGHE